ncbi:MAG: SDR family NAD(P)-dependent oxidoreductase [Burkholderiales bacterium]|nr:SDR family NAD(P)-dependent oxidoreductase [Burkholderiales bacterium]
MKKTCLITGASKGLGEALARRFWSAGYCLQLVARSHQDLRAVSESLSPINGQKCTLHVCDLSESSLVKELIHAVSSNLPKLDVLVNNAAIQGPIGPLCENDLLPWQQTLQVNLLAPVALCQGLVPLMKRSGGASIINLSGGGATGPRANFSAYAAAKAGLVRFSETIAEELKFDGIRVNCIAPGAMKTAMLQEVLDKGGAAGKREVSLASEVFEKGGASMDRVADLALFLASDYSKGISGKLISAVWDNWEEWPKHLDELSQSDVYTLRRIAGRDRGFVWGDK